MRPLHHIFVALALLSATPAALSHVSVAQAQENWAADDNSLEARKIERYQQLVEQSPEKSYAFTQLMNTVGKGAAYQKLLADYEKKVAAKPQNFNLRMILGHIYQHGGHTHNAIAAYRAALEIKQTPLAYMSIAAAEAENRNFEPAVEAYEAAAKLNPNKEQKQEIWRALAEIAIYRRDMEGARRYFAELISLEPNSLFIRRELSQIYAQNRLYADARQVLEDGLKLSSTRKEDKEQLELDIAMLYEQEGNDTEALNRYNALSKKLGTSHWMQRELTARIIEIHRRQGDIAGLVATLEKTWKSPTYDQMLELADLYAETSQPSKAQEYLQKAISKSPKLPEAHEKLVRHYRSHGQMDKMFDAQKALIKAVPDNPEYRFELYDAHIQQKQLDKAFAVLEEIQKQFTIDFDVQRRVAEAWQINGRTQKAQDIYENWAKKHPNDLEALEALGDQYDAAGEKKKALETWAKIENLPLDKATKLETLARIYDEHGYAQEAESLYAKSLKANPKDCQAHVQYADILTRNAHLDKAVEAWETLAQTCPESPMQTMAARQLASIYRSCGTEQKAIAQYKGKCESSPDNLNTFLLFGKLAEAMNRPAEAIPTLEAYTANHPAETKALNALNTLYAAAGDLQNARRILGDLANISETEKREAYIAMAEIDVKAGDLNAAHEHLIQAIKLNANDADIHEKLGDILVSLRRYDEAANYYETACQIDNRNFHIAFKHATVLSILGKDKEADDVYVRIVTDSPDQALALKSAQRAIDSHTWRGTLDELANSLLPLLRSNQRRIMYMEILLQLADAQAQPHVLALKTQDASHTLTARHALKELGEKYSTLLVESLLSNDASVSAQAVTLSEWLASAAVIHVLGQKIENAPTTETGRQMQLQAVKAIAHAQLPASVPVVKKCLEPQNSRALREHALWALGLIQATSATDVLKESLSLNFDSFRAIAVIGLGRQGAHLDKLQKLLTSDPSAIVKDAAAWALAYQQVKSANSDIEKYLTTDLTRPHQLWTLAQVNPKAAAPKILEALWCGTPETRQMAARLMHASQTKANLKTITWLEARGEMIQGMSSHYLSDFNTSMLLTHFAELATDAHAEQTPDTWLTTHETAFVQQVQKVASGTLKPHDTQMPANSCQLQMLRDFLNSDALPRLNTASTVQNPILAKAIHGILPQLKTWITRGHDNAESRTLAGISLQAAVIANTEEAIIWASETAANHADKALKLDAIHALGMSRHTKARDALKSLAKDANYLVRATALSYLNPDAADERQILESATQDPFAIVSETATRRLTKKARSV